MAQKKVQNKKEKEKEVEKNGSTKKGMRDDLYIL